MQNNETVNALARWILELRERARTNVELAGILLDTMPEGVSFETIRKLGELKDGVTATELQLIREGKKIAAIKEIRTRTGFGLKESKELADKAQDLDKARNPGFYQDRPGQFHNW